MHLFLSPHFDDAVLSCGGTIHHLIQAGERVVVINMMAGPIPSPAPDSPIVRDLHQRWQSGYDPVALRIKEDKNALNRLGVSEIIYFSLPDCIYRVGTQGQVLYTIESDLFGPVHSDDSAPTQLIDELEQHREIFSRSAIIYAPMGVGNHVDHQIVCDVSIEWAKLRADITLKLYEEYPYIKNPRAVEKARNSVDNLILADISLIETDVMAKIDAIAAYTSQISTFWDNVNMMARDVRSILTLTGNGHPAERFWIYPT